MYQYYDNFGNKTHFVNVLKQTDLLDFVLENDDDSWGETLRDIETHFGLLVVGGAVDYPEEFKKSKIKNPVCFIIQYILDNKIQYIDKISCRDLYNIYLQWCQIEDEEPCSRKGFGVELTKLGAGRKRSAVKRLYTIDRKEIIKKILMIYA
jgi:hypothetical protein